VELYSQATVTFRIVSYLILIPKELDGSLLSQTVLDLLTKESFSDVFIFSHGWLGDIPAARSQYNRWIQAMAKNTTDIEKLKQIRPNYKPLLIGLHWPSLPWGDEKIPAGSQEEVVQAMVSHYAEQIADSAAAKTAIETIFTEALGDMARYLSKCYLATR